jgi:hypothetical protein
MATNYTQDFNNVKVIISGAALDEILRSTDGPAVRNMMQRGEKLKDLARAQIPLGHVHGGSGYGNLRDSVVMRIMTPPGSNGMPIVVVGSTHPIALIHHEGTRPHMIRPRYKKALRFPGATGGGYGWIFSKWVAHPGTRPNRYLTDNLPAAMAN